MHMSVVGIHILMSIPLSSYASSIISSSSGGSSNSGTCLTYTSKHRSQYPSFDHATPMFLTRRSFETPLQ
jgi:hypothetical protein